MDKQEFFRLSELPLLELMAAANAARRDSRGSGLELCSIINAKSGLCGEDCKFCAQSGRHPSGIKAYPLKNKKEMVNAALAAEGSGAQRFGIVASGDSLSGEDLEAVAGAAAEITRKAKIKLCASLGTLSKGAFELLRNSGLSRYHHNIETSRNYFPRVATTHSFQSRIDTINAAKDAGLEVCSGGIIGMGESRQDRIEMALCLKELDVDSVPLNLLIPIKGTPLENIEPIACEEAVRTIAIFRIILKDKIIKIAAGRESILKDFQAMAFMAGANGMLIGGYLTVKGREIKDDLRLAEEVIRLWQR